MVSETEKVKVMAVDDSKTMLAMIATHLKESKFEVVTTASSTAEALTKYREKKPDIVLLDIIMPETTGSETLQRFLETDKNVRVVIISTIGTNSAAQDCLKLGARGILQKPLQKEEMLKMLDKVCREARVAL